VFPPTIPRVEPPGRSGALWELREMQNRRPNQGVLELAQLRDDIDSLNRLFTWMSQLVSLKERRQPDIREGNVPDHENDGFRLTRRKKAHAIAVGDIGFHKSSGGDGTLG